MSPDKHVISGIVLGTGSYMLTKDITLAGASALSAFMCDIDHLLEYSVYCMRYKVKPSTKEFFSGIYFEKKARIVIPFHGYEYLLILLVLAFISKSSVIIGIALGYALHMILDTIGNDCTFLGYCILYRLTVHFQLDKICVKGKRKNENNFNSNTNI